LLAAHNVLPHFRQTVYACVTQGWTISTRLLQAEVMNYE